MAALATVNPDHRLPDRGRTLPRLLLKSKGTIVRFRHPAFVSASLVLLAACSPGGPSATALSTPSPEVSPRTSAAATRIEVDLTDGLRMEPSSITVPAGVPVSFVVTNNGALEHEFYLGDEAAQAEHEEEMLAMGGMGHDEPEGIAVGPGETKELTYTFAAPGETLAGCHVAGHYIGGMKATITIKA
jgi:uncharacterized cupredoxin-like copper-binding protein